MLKFVFSVAAFLMSFPAWAAEFYFDFSQFPVGQCPSNYTSLVSGGGKPGDWKIITDDVSPMLAPLTTDAVKTIKRPVLAQTATDTTDEHFPLLLMDREIFGDFTLTTRFKIVRGEVEQMAGIAFRARDEKNYYVVRFNALNNNFAFYKFVDGTRYPPVKTDVNVLPGVWHEMKLTCQGSQTTCQLDGKDCAPPITDTTFASGKIGFWTKSDSVSYFIDTKIEYTPKVPFAQTLVNETMKEHPRLLGLSLYAMKDSQTPRVIASNDEKELGQEGGKTEADTIGNGHIYRLKKEGAVEVTMPLRDRNGDIAAAMKVKAKSFVGETEKTSIERATIILKFMQTRFGAVPDLMQ